MKELTINSLCRVCLKHSYFYSNIYKDQSMNQLLVYELLNDVCDLGIYLGDGLPESVCVDCFRKVVEFESFKTNAHKGKSSLVLLKERMENEYLNELKASVSLSAVEPSAASMEDSTQPVIKQEELDISGDEYEEPFNELNFGPIRLKDEMLIVYGDRNGQEDLLKSEASVSLSAVEPSAASLEDSAQPFLWTALSAFVLMKFFNTAELPFWCQFIIMYQSLKNDKFIYFLNDMVPLRLESDDEATDPIEEQFTHSGTVAHLPHLECLEDKSPHCRFNGAVDADSSNRNISIDEKSRYISCDVEFEASLSGIVERRQGIHPGESMCMTSLLEGDVPITKEESGMEEKKAGAEEGRGSAAEKGVKGERNSFKCYHCGNELMTKRGLVKHMEVHGFGTSYECETCGNVIQSNSKLINHVFKKTGSKQFNCVDCRNSVSQNIIHKRQMGSQMGSKLHKCLDCNKCFSQSYYLSKHIRTHTGTKPFKCLECGKCFRQNSHLIVHEKLHTGSKPYLCMECNKCFTQNISLIRHMRIHTGSKPYQCTECSKCFSIKCNLITHMRSHTGSKPYKCLECSKCYSDRSNLTTHMRSHTGFKPYQCMECNECFSQSSHLSTHIRSHTKIKPFKCLECGKCFSQSSHLSAHKKLHAGSKPYQCMECSKWFSQSSHLTAHRKCHMGSFNCETCSKRFTQRSHLQSHLLVHTKEKCHECHNCRKRFSRRAGLKVHLERYCKGIRK